ncbi:hypothetical protein [Nocardioides sp. GY 10127]|uniref:hypothetical protein n=1 Tax=Nocardioides sp. GY 10127 TaxID=2569762 RepID=UPI0010A7E7A1|nr:hypothetical protein [Nocardioides sp. GY 10127]TIC81561.1 hypothetical protein E8D37_10065 [Nocardioides sp. GY 10127]
MTAQLPPPAPRPGPERPGPERHSPERHSPERHGPERPGVEHAADAWPDLWFLAPVVALWLSVAVERQRLDEAALLWTGLATLAAAGCWQWLRRGDVTNRLTWFLLAGGVAVCLASAYANPGVSLLRFLVGLVGLVAGVLLAQQAHRHARPGPRLRRRARQLVLHLVEPLRVAEARDVAREEAARRAVRQREPREPREPRHPWSVESRGDSAR